MKDTFFEKTHCDRCGRELLGCRIMSMYNEDCLCMPCKEDETKRQDYSEVSKNDALQYLHRNGVVTEHTNYDLSKNPAVRLYELAYKHQTMGYRFKLCSHLGNESWYDLDIDTFNQCTHTFAFAPPSNKINLELRGSSLVSAEELSSKRRITELKSVGELIMVLKKLALL